MNSRSDVLAASRKIRCDRRRLIRLYSLRRFRGEMARSGSRGRLWRQTAEWANACAMCAIAARAARHPSAGTVGEEACARAAADYYRARSAARRDVLLIRFCWAQGTPASSPALAAECPEHGITSWEPIASYYVPIAATYGTPLPLQNSSSTENAIAARRKMRELKRNTCNRTGVA